jgi:hypothetical protein
MQRAKTFLEDYEGCIHSPSFPGFDYMSDSEARAFEAKRNQENVNCYYELCNELVQLSNNTSLHWRHAELAQSLLSLLLRRDIEYPQSALLIFARLLSSDVIRSTFSILNICVIN